RWENLLKKRLLVHVDAVKEFYAKMTSDSLEEKGHCEVQGRKSAIIEMKPSQRFIHFLGNEKCDTSIWEERHIKPLGLDIYGSLNGKEDHESPHGDWLTLIFKHSGVPLVIKKGEEPKKYDFFEDTFLTMCKPTVEDGIWWIGSGENRRRDDDEALQRKRRKVMMKGTRMTLIGRRN
ncbi:hypothetical protein Dimus_003883, partial [Dionaea muscipula]